MDGILLINKDKDWTSHDVCNRIKHIFNTSKVGHSGTLDPFATGLLIVAINKATKTLPYADFSYKTYVAKLKLGSQTVSGDLSSEVILKKDVPILTEDKINEVLHTFLGESEQKVPMYSAVHVNGVKLYKYAQQGIEVDRPTRKIDIQYIKLLDFSSDIITFQCLVSSGTYIRTLGEDIAKELNTVGHLISLNRIAIGKEENITLDKAIKLDEVNENKVLPVTDFIDLPKLEIDDKIYQKAQHGATIILNNEEEKILLVYNHIALAIYKKVEGNIYHCERGLW